MRLVKFSGIVVLLFMLILACESKKSEAEYYQTANKAFSEENFEKAIENFNKLIKYYPEGERASRAHFMLGFIYANGLKDLDKAEKYYSEFIKKYPDDELADDAQYELDHLGKDINELPIFKNITGDSTAAE